MSFPLAVKFWNWLNIECFCFILKCKDFCHFVVLFSYLNICLFWVCTSFRSNLKQLKTKKTTKIQFSTPISTFNSLLKWHDPRLVNFDTKITFKSQIDAFTILSNQLLSANATMCRNWSCLPRKLKTYKAFSMFPILVTNLWHVGRLSC